MKLNKDVLTTKMHKANKWTKSPSKDAKKAKQIRMSILAANVGDVYHDEFSAQKQKVVDDIVFKSVETGVYVAHVDTLKKNVIKVNTGKRGIGATTVKETVRLLRLHASQEFYIGQIGNGNAGAYVFVDLRHPKAHLIMADLFKVMIAAPGVNNVSQVESATTGEQLDGQFDEQLDGFPQIAENVDTPAVEKPKTKSLSFFSKFSFFKDLKPKQEAPVNLYGKVCKVMNVVGQSKSVTQVMRMIEKAKKEFMNLTDDIVIHAVHEAIKNESNNVAAYARKVINNLANPVKNFSKSVFEKVEGYTPSWLKEGVHKQHVTAEQTENDPELEAMRLANLARLGY